MTKDCFEILTCMAGHPLGHIAMCEHGSLSALCHAFVAGNHCKHSKETFTVLNDCFVLKKSILDSYFMFHITLIQTPFTVCLDVRIFAWN